MLPWHDALILLAGLGAGAINAIVGSGTLITFPTLVALGVPPVMANVSNTVGLFPGSFVAAWGYRREMAGQGRRVVTLGSASVVGAIIGAALLLLLPATAFDAIVPALIIIALLLVIFGKRLTAWMRRRGRTTGEGAAAEAASGGRTLHDGAAAGAAMQTRTSVALWTVILVTGMYGGYFGAGQGILLMGIFGILLAAESIQRQNALKNVLAGMVNLVAAIVFVATAEIDWAAAGLIAVGAIVGGYLGARFGRRLPAWALRTIIVIVGLIAVVKLLLP